MQKNQNIWNAEKYEKHADFVPRLAFPLIDLLGDIKGKKILDVGCGDGTLTLELVNRGADVIGIDSSPEMVKASKSKGIKAILGTATDLPFYEEFDAVFSNAVLHWVPEAEKALENIAKSLKDGGIFVAEFGGKGNIQSIIQAMEQVFEENPEFGKFKNIWYFPDANEYKSLLEKAGFKVEYIELIPRPTPIDHIQNWLEIFTNVYTSHLAKSQINLFRSRVRELLKSRLYTPEKGWVADYVRLRLKAVKNYRLVKSALNSYIDNMI
ncbi:class I SAM-dependent methyltransferase [Persephonella sp.]